MLANSINAATDSTSIGFMDSYGFLHTCERQATLISALDICACGCIHDVQRMVIETLQNAKSYEDLSRSLPSTVLKEKKAFCDLIVHWFYEMDLVNHGETLDVSTLTSLARQEEQQIGSGLTTHWVAEHRLALWHAIWFVENSPSFTITKAVSDWVEKNSVLAGHLFMAFLREKDLINQIRISPMNLSISDLGARISSFPAQVS